VVKSSQRKVIVQDKSVSIGLACTTFGVSEICYCYRSALNDENEEIAIWLLLVTSFGVLDGITNGCIVFNVSWN